MVLNRLALLLLLEDKEIDCLAQMAKGHLYHLLRFFGKLIGDQVSFGIYELVNEDFHIFKNKGPKNAIVGDSDCL